MVGLLGQYMGGEEDQRDPTDPLGRQPASPEEQAQFGTFMDNARKLVYSKETFPAVKERVLASGDPVEGLAFVTATSALALNNSAEKSGVPLSHDVLFHGGLTLLNDLSQFFTQTGIHSFSEDDTIRASGAAVDMYRKLTEGTNPPDQATTLENLKDFNAMVESGQFEKMVGPERFRALSQRIGEQSEQPPTPVPPAGNAMGPSPMARSPLPILS